MSHALLCTLLLTCSEGQIPTIDSSEFSKPLQEKSVLATVRVINERKELRASGVIVGRSGSVAYVLSAAHLADPNDELEVHVFSKDSYPKAQKVYRAVRVIARTTENNQDLILARISDFVGDSVTMEIAPLTAIPKQKTFAAFSIGCGLSKMPTLRSRSISGPVLASRSIEAAPARFWCSAQKPIQGESGGPLVNSRGELLGICSGVHSDRGFYVYLEDVHDFLRANALGSFLPKTPAK